MLNVAHSLSKLTCKTGINTLRNLFLAHSTSHKATNYVIITVTTPPPLVSRLALCLCVLVGHGWIVSY